MKTKLEVIACKQKICKVLKKQLQKYHRVCFLLVLLVDTRLALQCVCIPSETPKNNYFLCDPLLIGDNFWFREGVSVYFHSQHRCSVRLRPVQPCDCCMLSTTSHECEPCCV